MKEEIKKISIENGFFGSVVLDLFAKDKERVSIVYGANGTGKTTIGRAFMFIKNPTGYNEFIKNSLILDSNNAPIILSEEDKQKIHVFNEDFIDKEVSFRSLDKMKSIVMFGKNIENEIKITKLLEDIERDKKSVIDLELDRYDDRKDPLSHLMYYDRIKKEASQDWAIEEQEILERQTKPPVSEDVMERILGYDVSKKFDLSNYQIQKNSFKKLAGKNPQPITEPITNNKNIEIDYKKVVQLLQKQHNKPIGSIIVQRIAKTLQEKTLSRLYEIQESFSNGYCPYCFRDIETDYVEHIVDEINNIQNDEIKDHIDKLKKSKIELLRSDYSIYQFINKDLVSIIHEKVSRINNYIDELNRKIDQKIDNPYDSIYANNLDLHDLDYLFNDLNQLEKLRQDYNKDITNKTKLKSDLQKLNIDRFSYSVKLLVTSYNVQIKEWKSKLDQKYKLEKQIEDNNTKVNGLVAESKNIGIALRVMNEYLGLIFLSKSRLYLEESNGSYLVKRGTNSIPLKKLSNGERNAISLCYFFARMNENQTEDSMFNVPSLIVLDDPLSSFDHNNKLGIYAYLRRMMSEVLRIDKSKVLLLTHQIETFYDLQKVVSDIDRKYARASVLVDKKLELVESNKFNLYKESLKEIYKAITKPTPLSDDEIESMGNKLRKVTEAFSTFIYGCGIEKLSTDPTISGSIQPEKLRNYFIDSMYRIALHSTSHFEERAQSIFDLLNIGYFDRDGLMRSLKDTLSLMYVLNQKHVIKMLEITDVTFFNDYVSEILET